jgi:hypothetical protein
MQDSDRKKTFDTVAQGYDNPAMRFFAESVPHLILYLHLAKMRGGNPGHDLEAYRYPDQMPERLSGCRF